jgi:hypothetical protein
MSILERRLREPLHRALVQYDLSVVLEGLPPRQETCPAVMAQMGGGTVLS